MKDKELPEYWLRGKVEGILDLLQPVAHSILQSREEVQVYMKDFPEYLLWEKPAGRASVGFHLLHLSGVLNRLMTYSKGHNLSEEQLEYLKSEGVEDSKIYSEKLIQDFNNNVDEAILYLKTVPETSLTELRRVGRKQLPSTVIGLLFHAAEHTQRHIGQLLVTISIVKNSV